MKISVVTNAFNQGQYLAAAAESVLSQQGAEIEYWIVEPGSSDNTPAVIAAIEARFPGRVNVLREKDDGPADGLNRGFAHATGDWFIYLNADDVFLPGAFREAVKAFHDHPEAGAVIGNGYIVGDDGAYIRRAISSRFSARRFVRGQSFALQQSTFYRADAFRAVGGFNLQNTTSWDAEILVDMDRRGYPLINVGGDWSLFRMQPNSITVSQRFAEESALTHQRYFREEMGRERTSRDVHANRLRQLFHHVRHPWQTLQRVRDRIAPPNRRFAEADTPAWARDL